MHSESPTQDGVRRVPWLLSQDDKQAESVPYQEGETRNTMTRTGQLRDVLTEDRLIDALRGCSSRDELLSLQRRLAEEADAPPLFDWICNLLVSRRLSRGLAARLLTQLHQNH